VGIAAGAIDNMFAWGASVPVGHQKRTDYAQAILDLLDLQTGRSLIERIINDCHTNIVNNRNPQSILFMGQATPTRFFPNNGTNSTINLEWDAANNTYKTQRWVMPVRNSVNNKLDFVEVEVPLAVLLAHEFSHFVYALEIPVGVGGMTLVQRMENQAVTEYDDIFAGVIAYKRKPVKMMSRAAKGRPINYKACRLFKGSWNHGEYAEAVVILPTCNMLQVVPVGANRLRYSDGIMIAEALHAWPVGNPRRPQFFGLATNVGIPVNTGNNTGVVRFSHNGADEFCRDFFNPLRPIEQTQFKTMVKKLLGKISVPNLGGGGGGTRGLTINDLPWI
jgi:hypothetical protein